MYTFRMFSSLKLFNNKILFILFNFFVFANISLVVSYSLTFYLGVSTDQALLFNASDLPYVHPGYKLEPIIGKHYFGDFQTHLSFSQGNFPYSPDLVFPAPYPPFGILVFKPLAILPPLVGVLLFSIIACSLLVWAFLNFYNGEDRHNLAILIFPLLLFTKPFLLGLDRGNIQLIIVGLCLVSFKLYKEEKLVGAAIAITIAGAIKLYPLLFLIPLIRLRKIRIFIFSVSSALLLNIVSLQLFYGGLSANHLLGFLKGISIQSQYGTSGIGWVAYLARLAEGWGVFQHSLEPNTHLRVISTSLGIILITFFLYKYCFTDSLTLSDGLWIIFILQSFLILTSWAYNLIWVGFYILDKYVKIDEKKDESSYHPNRFVISVMVFSLLPMPLIWSGDTRVGVTHIEMILPLVFFAIFVNSLRNSRRR